MTTQEQQELEKKALEQFISGKSLVGWYGTFAPRLKNFIETALKSAMEDHLIGQERAKGNQRHGEGKKTVKSGLGIFFYGTKDILHVGSYGIQPELMSGKPIDVPKTEGRGEEEMGLSWTHGAHEMDWVRACKENPESRKPITSAFAEAVPLKEMAVRGVRGVRLQTLNKILVWDDANVRFINSGATKKLEQSSAMVS